MCPISGAFCRAGRRAPGICPARTGLIRPQGQPEGGSRDCRPGGPRDVVYINRQRGAGTRVLLDYRLNRQASTTQHSATNAGIHASGVAAAVASGAADCGMESWRRPRPGLDFVPLDSERYDLVIPAKTYGGEILRRCWRLIRSPGVRARFTALGATPPPHREVLWTTAGDVMSLCTGSAGRVSNRQPKVVNATQVQIHYLPEVKP